MTWVFVASLMLIWAGIVLWVASTAKQWGRSPWFWGLVAAFFHLLAWLPLLLGNWLEPKGKAGAGMGGMRLTLSNKSLSKPE
jgi:uncharacterized membrane protein YbhN (UPF0104 family)